HLSISFFLREEPGILPSSNVAQLSCRQGKEESASPARFASHPDFSPMHFQQFLGDGQAEPHTFDFWPACLRYLIKLIEDFVCLLWRDTGACIGNRYLHPSGAISLGGHRHFTVWRGKLDGIAYKVIQHLDDPVSIRPCR